MGLKRFQRSSVIPLSEAEMRPAFPSGPTDVAKVWSEKSNERYADSHESAANDAPEVQTMRRHVHQAKVIDRERGQEVRGDDQPIDWSGSERVDERSFAHVLERGGMRRTWLRGRENVHKRYLIHVAGYNLGIPMRGLLSLIHI